MKFHAMQRFQKRVKPGEYVDQDLFGRGDFRLCGPDAQNQEDEAQERLEEELRRERSGRFNLRTVVFPTGIKAISQKARAFVRRISSSRTDDQKSEIVVNPADDNHRCEEIVLNNVVHDGTEEEQDISATGVVNEECEGHVAIGEDISSVQEKPPKEDDVTDAISKTVEETDAEIVNEIGIPDSRAPGGSNELPENCSSTEDEHFPENIESNIILDNEAAEGCATRVVVYSHQAMEEIASWSTSLKRRLTNFWRKVVQRVMRMIASVLPSVQRALRMRLFRRTRTRMSFGRFLLVDVRRIILRIMVFTCFVGETLGGSLYYHSLALFVCVIISLLLCY